MTEKNAAMRALGVSLIEFGSDFQESREHAIGLAVQTGVHMVPSFHPDLLRGVSTYWWELFKAVPQLDVVYVPIGQGSGACAASFAAAMQERGQLLGITEHGTHTSRKRIRPPAQRCAIHGVRCFQSDY